LPPPNPFITKHLQANILGKQATVNNSISNGLIAHNGFAPLSNGIATISSQLLNGNSMNSLTGNNTSSTSTITTQNGNKMNGNNLMKSLLNGNTNKIHARNYFNHISTNANSIHSQSNNSLLNETDASSYSLHTNSNMILNSSGSGGLLNATQINMNGLSNNYNNNNNNNNSHNNGHSYVQSNAVAANTSVTNGHQQLNLHNPLITTTLTLNNQAHQHQHQPHNHHQPHQQQQHQQHQHHQHQQQPQPQRFANGNSHLPIRERTNVHLYSNNNTNNNERASRNSKMIPYEKNFVVNGGGTGAGIVTVRKELSGYANNPIKENQANKSFNQQQQQQHLASAKYSNGPMDSNKTSILNNMYTNSLNNTINGTVNSYSNNNQVNRPFNSGNTANHSANVSSRNVLSSKQMNNQTNAAKREASKSDYLTSNGILFFLDFFLSIKFLFIS
jgi:hypothetical protein